MNGFDELADVIYDAMPWEGETYQAAAESIAVAVINAGWHHDNLTTGSM